MNRDRRLDLGFRLRVRMRDNLMGLGDASAGRRRDVLIRTGDLCGIGHRVVQRLAMQQKRSRGRGHAGMGVSRDASRQGDHPN